MRDAAGQADVLVEVEGGDLVPAHVRLGHERAEHLKLRSAGGDYDVGDAALADRRADCLGAVVGGALAGLLFGVGGLDVHDVNVLNSTWAANVVILSRYSG